MTDDVGRVLPQGTGMPATIPGPIFAAAVDTFVAGQRLDMRWLARRVGVARATLYRQVGNREQLLDQVLWWRARLLLADQVRASAHLNGTDRITTVTGGVLRAIGADRPVRMFLESEPETALRVLTGSRSTVHQGMAAALENLIDLERGRGAFEPSLDTPTLAFAIVRVADGFLYTDVIADRGPGIGRAVIAIEALLRGLNLVHRTPVTAGLREP
jgi:AcrR family transcriptional regulator